MMKIGVRHNLKKKRLTIHLRCLMLEELENKDINKVKFYNLTIRNLEPRIVLKELDIMIQL